MFEANVMILKELRDFVLTICNDRELLNYFSISEKDFTRTRKLPFDKLVLLIAKLCKKTLSVELERFFEEMGVDMSCSVSAFTQQRMKLKPVFFYLWNMVLQKSFYHHNANEVKRWKGFRLISADGSTVSLISTEELSKNFGGGENQNASFTVAKSFYHYDILNELIVYCNVKPYRYGEINMAYDAINFIEEDMLTIYDRNFGYYRVFALHLWKEKERKFIIRAKEKEKRIVRFIESGKSSSIVELKPSPGSILGLKKEGFIVTRDTVIKVRLIRVDLPSGVEVLMTNLWEDEGHSIEEFKALYFMRWGIETNFAFQKNVLQLEAFSGLTVCSVLQDFYATVVMSNLHSIVIKDAQKTVDLDRKPRKYPMKINKNKSFGKLKVYLVDLFLNNDVASILQKLHDHFIREVIPIRKGRSYPRTKKNVQTRTKFKTYANFKPSY
jgi:hypothetical protein